MPGSPPSTTCWPRRRSGTAVIIGRAGPGPYGVSCSLHEHSEGINTPKPPQGALRPRLEARLSSSAGLRTRIELAAYEQVGHGVSARSGVSSSLREGLALEMLMQRARASLRIAGSSLGPGLPGRRASARHRPCRAAWPSTPRHPTVDTRQGAAILYWHSHIESAKASGVERFDRPPGTGEVRGRKPNRVPAGTQPGTSGPAGRGRRAV